MTYLDCGDEIVAEGSGLESTQIVEPKTLN